MKKIWFFYRYYFYRTQRWQAKIWKDDKEWIAPIGGLGGLIMMNYVEILILIGLILWNDITFIEKHKELIIIPAFMIFIVLYFLLVYNNKLEKIIKEFQHESEHNRKRRFIYIWIYVIGTFLLLFILGFIGRLLKS